MKLAVFSHKPCWRSQNSPTGVSTDGGFPFQMRALAELFDSTTIVVPVYRLSSTAGETALSGRNLRVAPLTAIAGRGLARRVATFCWLSRNLPRLVLEASRADVIHAPIPGDVGTFGMILALIMRKRLIVRHCGNWDFQRTVAERFWRWFMERYAGGRNIMLATGGADRPPSGKNPNIKWIFSTSLTREELDRCRIERDPPNPAAPRLINVCRQEKFKGTEILLECLPLLLDRFPGITLDLIGDGNAIGDLRKRADALGIAGRVRFLGRLDHDNVLRLLHSADLFCYPTRSDGFPKAVLEALACGLPVITTPVSVLPQLIGSGCGTIVGDPAPGAFAAAIADALSNEGNWRAMSNRAYLTARQYSLESWRERIGELLRESQP